MTISALLFAAMVCSKLVRLARLRSLRRMFQKGVAIRAGSLKWLGHLLRIRFRVSITGTACGSLTSSPDNCAVSMSTSGTPDSIHFAQSRPHLSQQITLEVSLGPMLCNAVAKFPRNPTFANISMAGSRDIGRLLAVLIARRQHCLAACVAH